MEWQPGADRTLVLPEEAAAPAASVTVVDEWKGEKPLVTVDTPAPPAPASTNGERPAGLARQGRVEAAEPRQLPCCYGRPVGQGSARAAPCPWAGDREQQGGFAAGLPPCSNAWLFQ